MATDDLTPDNDQKLVPIGEAAEILGVSIDTVRRWDKKGILHSSRPDGKNRHFSIDELEKIKFSRPLSITAVSRQLGVSVDTLRRLEEKGVLVPERNAKGERSYTQAVIQKYLDSEYFMRQKEVQEKILEPLKEPAKHTDAVVPMPGELPTPDQATTQKVVTHVLADNQRDLSRLQVFRRTFYAAGIFLATLFVLIISALTVSFLMYPEDTGQFFGWYRVKPLVISHTEEPTTTDKGKVLGAIYTAEGELDSNPVGLVASSADISTTARLLRPFSEVSLGIVRRLDPEAYDRAIATVDFPDDQYLAINPQGQLVPNYTLTFPDTSYLAIPDDELVQNLNAEYLQGRVPGTQANNLLVLDPVGNLVFNGSIESESVTSSSIANGAITNEHLSVGIIESVNLAPDSVTSPIIKDGEVNTADLANEAVTTDVLASSSVTSAKISTDAVLSVHIDQDAVLSGAIKDGEVTTADVAAGAVITEKLGTAAVTTEKLADEAVTSEKINDGTVATADVADEAITGDKVANNTLTSTDLSGTLTFEDGDFIDLSAITHDDTAPQGIRLPNASSDTPSSPSSGEGYLAWDTSGNQLIVYDGSSWTTVTGGGGSGDITAVGDCTTGDCFTGTNGTTLTFNDSDGDGVLTIANLTGARTYTLPDASGTVIVSGHTLTGDVTGTIGSSGTTALTIANNAVALTTDTTGDYVGTITAGTGISSTGATSGEGIAHTISATLGTSIAGSEVDDDTLDFAQFQDTLDLDAATEINLGANAFTIDLDSTGDFIIADAGVASTTFSDDGNVTMTGTLTVPTLTLSGTGTLNGLDAIDATTEATLEGALDLTGDISGTLAANTIGADKVLESHLKAVDAAADEECLTYETTTGDFEWQSCDVVTDTDDQNLFETIAVASQSNIVADSPTDTFTFEAGSNVTLTTNATTDTLTIAATDTNTTYTAGTDLDLTGTTFSLETVLDSVETINLAGTGTLNGLDAIDATTEATLEGALDIAGDVTGTGLTSVTVAKINGATLGTTTATSGNLLLGDGDSWESVAMSGDATIASTGALTIANNAVALTTDTTGNYVADVSGGNGVTVTGSAGEGWTPAVAVDLLDSADGTGATSSNSGLEFQGSGTDELALLQGCSANELLKWNDASNVWECASDATGGGSSSFTLAGDTGSSQTLTDGDTITIATGSHLTATAGATDTVTITLDDDTLDFAQFQDTLDLDAATEINLGANAFTIDLDSTGDFIIADAGTPSTTFSDDGNVTMTGTLTVPTLTLSGTGTLNGLDAIDATTEATLEGALDLTGDISGTLAANTIGADKVLESHLKAVDAASDEECLTYETTTGDFEWEGCDADVSLTLAGTSGDNQTITNGDTITIAAGTGITTTGGATDTVTIASTLGTSITGAEVDDDTLDFVDFEDTLDVDAATDINLGANLFSIDLDSTGDFEIRDGTTQFFRFRDDSAMLATFPAAGFFFVDASTTASQAGDGAGVLWLDVNSATAGNAGFFVDYTVNNGTATGDDLYGARLRLTMDDADADLFGLEIAARQSVNAGAGSFECLLCLTNAENTAGTVMDAIRISDTSSTAGAIATAIDIDSSNVTTDIELQNGETIDNNTDGTIALTAASTTLSGDLTISGDDLVMATNTSGYLLVADGTNFNPVAMSGDITIDSTGATAIGNDKVVEADLKAVDTASDEECLTYETTTGDFEWEGCDADVSLTLAGTSGDNQTITNGDTITIAAGTGITTTGGATDTVTIASTLGTSISNSELDNDTIDWDKIVDATSLDAATSITGTAGETLTLTRTLTDATDENGLTIGVTAADTTSGSTAQYGVSVTNAASTEGLDALLFLTNADTDDSVADGIRITSAAGTILTGLDFDDTDIVTDIELQNGETIDNNTDGTIALTAASTTLSGDLTISGDDLVMGTNTSGAVLVADGTNFNPVVMSGDVVIGTTGTATIQANAVALTTDTTGDYVGTITAGTGISSTGATSGEGIAHTISATLGTSIAGSEVDDDTLDFAQFQDTLDLDAATEINLGANAFTIDLDSTGDFIIADGGTPSTTFSDDGNVTMAGDLTVSGGDITGANSASIDIGEATSGALTFTAGSTGDFVFSLDADSNAQFTAGAAPGVDMVTISNSGQATGTNGVDGIFLTLEQADDGAVDTNSGINLALTGSGDTDASDTLRGINLATSGIAGGTLVGVNIAGITAGAGTENALVIGSGWDLGLSVASASSFTTSLTTGTGFTVTGMNTATTNTAVEQMLFSLTNAQATNANTNFAGLSLDFTNNPTIAGNTEVAARIQNQVTANTTDNAVSALLLLDNADTDASGSTVVTNALRIANSGDIDGGIINALNIDDTDVTNDIVLQNDEVIHNDTNGTITFTDGTNTLVTIAVNGTEGDLTTTGDLTISGDDLYMATNTDAYILVADGTNFNPVAMSGDITIDNTGATAIGSGVVDSDNVTDNALDYVDFEDTMDLDAALTLNQGANTWTQSYTDTSSVGFTYNADSVTDGGAQLLTANALTSGKVLNITSNSAAITTGQLLTAALTVSGDTNANKTGALTSISSSRTDTRTSGTTADDYDLLSLSRTSVQNGSGGTTTAAGSVLRIENVATQTAGTLTDTTKGIELVMDADGTGDAVFIDSNAAGAIALNIDAENTTTDAVNLSVAALTTGRALDIPDLNAVTTGKGINVASTSSGITTGELMSLALTNQTSNLANKTGNLVSISSDRQDLGSSGTTADDYDVFNVKRTSGVSIAGRAMTAAGSVVRFENESVQNLGLLTDTTRVVELVQDADSSGDALAIAHAGSGNALRINDDGTLTDSTPFVVDASGNVGIGDASPGVALEMVGRASIAPSGTTHDNIYNGNLVITKPAASGQYINIIRAGNAVWSMGMTYNTNNFAIGVGSSTDSNFTNPSFVIEAGGDVGIATANPAAKLHVDHGNATFGLTPAISLLLGLDTADRAGALKLMGTVDGSYGLIQQSTSNLHIDSVGASTYLNFYDGDNVVFGNGASGIAGIWEAGGDVGIGTAGPTARLTVAEANSTINSGHSTAGFHNDTMGVGGWMVNISTDDAVASNEYFIAMRSENDGSVDNEFLFRTDGTAHAEGSFLGGGADLAEYFNTNVPNIPKGTLISIDTSRPKNVRPATKHLGPLIGIVSTQPGLVANGGDAEIGKNREDDPNFTLVGLVGQIPARVNGENGVIAVGDGITISSVEGVGRKANPGEQIVGVAMTAYGGSGEGSVEVYVGHQSLATANSFQHVTAQVKAVEEAVAGLTSEVQQAMVAGTTTTATPEAIPTLTPTPTPEATPSTPLVPGTILSGDFTFSGALTAQNNLAVMGTLTVTADASFAGTLLADTVDIVSALTVQGVTNLLGDLAVAGDVAIQGRLTVSEQQAGLASIPRGGREVSVTYPKAYDVAPLVQVTPQAATGQYWISRQTPEGFTVTLAELASEGVTFNWLTLPVAAPTVVTGEVIDSNNNGVPDIDEGLVSATTPATSPSPTVPTPTPSPTPISPAVVPTGSPVITPVLTPTPTPTPSESTPTPTPVTPLPSPEVSATPVPATTPSPTVLP